MAQTPGIGMAPSGVAAAAWPFCWAREVVAAAETGLRTTGRQEVMTGNGRRRSWGRQITTPAAFRAARFPGVIVPAPEGGSGRTVNTAEPAIDAGRRDPIAAASENVADRLSGSAQLRRPGGGPPFAGGIARAQVSTESRRRRVSAGRQSIRVGEVEDILGLVHARKRCMRPDRATLGELSRWQLAARTEPSPVRILLQKTSRGCREERRRNATRRCTAGRRRLERFGVSRSERGHASSASVYCAR